MRSFRGVAAYGSPNDGLLFLASFNQLFAVNSDLRVAWSVDLKSDGIEFVSVTGGVLAVRHYQPSWGDWLPCQIRVADGAISSA